MTEIPPPLELRSSSSTSPRGKYELGSEDADQYGRDTNAPVSESPLVHEQSSILVDFKSCYDSDNSDKVSYATEAKRSHAPALSYLLTPDADQFTPVSNYSSDEVTPSPSPYRGRLSRQKFAFEAILRSRAGSVQEGYSGAILDDRTRLTKNARTISDRSSEISVSSRKSATASFTSPPLSGLSAPSELGPLREWKRFSLSEASALRESHSVVEFAVRIDEKLLRKSWIFRNYLSVDIQNRFMEFCYGRTARRSHALLYVFGIVLFGVYAVVEGITRRGESVSALVVLVVIEALMALLSGSMAILAIVHTQPRFYEWAVAVMLTLLQIRSILKNFVAPILNGVSPIAAADDPAMELTVLFFAAMIRPRPVVLLPVTIFGVVPQLAFLAVARFAAPRTLLFLVDGSASVLWTCLSVILSLGLSFVALVTFEYRARRLFEDRERLSFRAEWLEEESALSKSLLASLLPQCLHPLMEDREKDGIPIAKWISLDPCFVLWAVVCSFTAFCEPRQAHEVLSVLNTLCSAVDEWCNHHGICRLKTVGDAVCCYAIPAGNRNVEIHLVELGGVILRCSKSIGLRCRVGIACGSGHLCVFGSISTRLHFDLFGPAKNDAESLEQSALPDTIHVDEVVHRLTETEFPYTKHQSGSYLLASTALSDAQILISLSSVGSSSSPRSETVRHGRVFSPVASAQELCFPFLELRDSQNLVLCLRASHASSTWSCVVSVACVVLYHLHFLLVWAYYCDFGAFRPPQSGVVGLSCSVVFHCLLFVAFMIPPFRRNFVLALLSLVISAIVQRSLLIVTLTRPRDVYVPNFNSVLNLAQIVLLLYSPWPMIAKMAILGVDYALSICRFCEDFWFAADFSAFSSFLSSQYMPVLVLISAFIVDYQARQAWLAQCSIRVKEVDLSDNKRKTEALINSILPQSVSSLLRQNDFRCFSVDLRRSMAAFLKLDCQHLGDPSDWLPKLSSYFVAFHSIFSAVQAIPIKSTETTYLVFSGSVLSREQHRGDVAAAFINALFDCRSHVTDNPNGLVVSLHIACSFGPIGGGVIGMTRHLFDVWGASINRAARLVTMGASKRGVLMTKEDAVACCPSRLEFEELGGFELKGIGSRDCVLFEKPQES